MFQNYKYEKPRFIEGKNTDALTAAFAGGGWMHIKDRPNPMTEQAEKPQRHLSSWEKLQ